ncbi:hypothetical protein AOLI_G00040980 [Acnodon oligacanthus]
MFSVRIVCADYYMASPLAGLDVCYSDFRDSEVKRVPVVRIFGSTPAGQKTCLHLHGVLPYVYVPYDGFGQQPDRYLRQVAYSIDRAVNISLGNPRLHIPAHLQDHRSVRHAVLWLSCSGEALYEDLSL